MTSQHLSAYQKMEVTKATHDPNQLILMLYDGALKFIKAAALAIEQRDVEKRGIYIGKTLDIVAELNGCLDRNLDNDLVPFLEGMYKHIMQQLLQANLKQDRQSLAHAFKLVHELRRNWITYAIEGAAGARQDGTGTAAEIAAGARQDGGAGGAPGVRHPAPGTPRPTTSAPAAPPQARAYARMAAAPKAAGSGTQYPQRAETTAATVTAADPGHDDPAPPPYPATGTYGGGFYGRPAGTGVSRSFTI
ncbi:MAG: flagellar export chaperone FliS [Deltaproteobacteria bacterium]|nr:flagellar export chaperone FliS [Candidatus Anaeroferrophillacea bacterium]